MKLIFSPEVERARENGTALVACESTIISHGMPWPRNLETALSVEAEIRGAGAVPATIAVVEGSIHIGLTEAEITALAQAEDVMKLSRADLAYATALGRMGATTVAATMICAHLANIRVFATGGIGGVHREAGETFDISADLEELSLTPVAVVAAGAKAILDIPKTLEVLETKGVPVIGFGTDEFPAFWSRRSGLAAPLRLDDPADVAQTFLTRRELGLEGGMLVANPVSEADEIPFEEMSPHIDQALAEATSQNVSGKDVTPFVLGRIFNLTEGRSLETNVALVKNNARLAARIALALREISRLS